MVHTRIYTNIPIYMKLKSYFISIYFVRKLANVYLVYNKQVEIKMPMLT